MKSVSNFEGVELDAGDEARDAFLQRPALACHIELVRFIDEFQDAGETRVVDARDGRKLNANVERLQKLFTRHALTFGFAADLRLHHFCARFGFDSYRSRLRLRRQKQDVPPEVWLAAEYSHLRICGLHLCPVDRIIVDKQHVRRQQICLGKNFGHVFLTSDAS